MRFVQKSLSRKILTILTVSLVIPISIIIYLSASFQARNMIKEMTVFGNELAHAMYAGIRYPMSVGDSAAVSKQLLDMREKLQDVDVYVTDYAQQIVYGTRSELIGKTVDNEIYNQDYWRKIQESFRAVGETQITFEEKIGPNRFLTTVQLLPNQVDCHHCHGATQDILGSMVVRTPTNHTYQVIRTQTGRVVLLGLVGTCIVIFLIYTMLTNHVTTPVNRLGADMKNLPERIAAGDYLAPEPSGREDEVGHLERSFGEMANDLLEKRAVIERTNRELTTINRELEAFAYSVSHDLRAPLRNIDGFSKILLDDYQEKLDETGRHYLNRVRSGATKMSQLIDDILSFSRASRTEINPRVIDANSLVNEALRDFSETIKARDINVRVKDLPNINCDPNMIRTVFSNLISNAIKYSRDVERAELLIDYDETNKAIRFKDNGVGFDIKYQEKIFQVFQRLHLPEEYEGTGIGLAIVKRMIERHQGSIWAESEPGKGATFYVRLPVA